CATEQLQLGFEYW
nr:immunoglobulin heavy chain junction region [Macaca mulatta]MOV52309.1 immunoglobulin heavy chain junction region [Macaca mulatta]